MAIKMFAIFRAFVLTRFAIISDQSLFRECQVIPLPSLPIMHIDDGLWVSGLRRNTTTAAFDCQDDARREGVKREPVNVRNVLILIHGMKQDRTKKNSSLCLL